MDRQIYGSKYDWGYVTENNGITSQGFVNGEVQWPRGKMLGGSSGINGMIYIKGNFKDYKRWYDAGNEEWHPNVVEKYFIKAENLQDTELLKSAEVRKNYGTRGPLIINSFNVTSRRIADKIIEAWDEIGFKKVLDVSNLNNLRGSGRFRASAASGTRESTAKAYLNPIKNRKNLFIVKNALVTKVLINNKTKEVFGVSVEIHGKKFTFYANKEVILSAGSINTPQLLMLSGVGPREHLISKNIFCKVNSRMVGENLQDHGIVLVPVFGKEPEDQTTAEKSFAAIQYLYNREGYLGGKSTPDVSAFYSECANQTYPQFQSVPLLFGKNSSSVREFYNTIKVKPSVIESIVKQNINNALYIFRFILLHPFSKGNIKLRSNDPKQYPIIYANYFKDPRDLDAAVVGIKMLTKIVNTKYFKSIGGFLGRIDWPPCNKFVLDTNEYWRCIALNFITTVYHPTGTTRMGRNINVSVVDSRLRVHGLKKLRIIDAGVMPFTVSANTNAPSVMVGERGADLVKEDYRKCPSGRCPC